MPFAFLADLAKRFHARYSEDEIADADEDGMAAWEGEITALIVSGRLRWRDAPRADVRGVGVGQHQYEQSPPVDPIRASLQFSTRLCRDMLCREFMRCCSFLGDLGFRLRKLSSQASR